MAGVRFRSPARVDPNHPFVTTLAGVEMPRMLYGTAWKKERTAALVVQAVLAGFRGIDTACQPKHYREDMVGAALSQLVAKHGITRKQLFLQTKFTSASGQDPHNIPYDAEAPLAKQVRQSFEQSLRNLQTDYVDSFVLHGPLTTMPETMEVWREMEALHRAGKVRQLGLSNFYNVQLLAALWDQAQVKPAVLQNRFIRETGFELINREFCQDHGMVFQSFWTLTGNPDILSSKVLSRVAQALNRTPEQVFYRFVIELGIVPLSGTSNPLHMAEDLSVFQFSLSDADHQRLQELLV